MSEFVGISPLGVVLAMLVMFLAFFVVTFIVMMLLRGLGQLNRSGNAPRLTVSAVITGRRQASYRRMGKTSETYYVTFQVDSGDRMEFAVDGTEYGTLSVGDAGQLTFQGSNYLAFVRN